MRDHLPFAQKMGYKGFDFENAAGIYAEHAKLTAKTNIDISGLSYEILKEKKQYNGLCKKNARKGTQVIYR
jgi:ferredoxin-nitrate reductase